MINPPLSGYDGNMVACASDKGVCGGYLATFGQWRAWPIYEGYFIEWSVDLGMDVIAADVAVYIYEDGSLIDTVQDTTRYFYMFDRNKIACQLDLILGPANWSEYLQPEEPHNKITLALSHDDTATSFTVQRRSANGAIWYYVDRLDKREFTIVPAGTYGGQHLTVYGTPGHEINASGYMLITVTDGYHEYMDDIYQAKYKVKYILAGIEVAESGEIEVSTEPIQSIGGMWLSFDDLYYNSGDSWRVDIGLPKQWTSPRLERQETGEDGNAVVLRVDSTNASNVTVPGLESSAAYFDAVDPAPTLLDHNYLGLHRLELVLEVGDLYQFHQPGQTVTGGNCQEFRVYKNRGWLGEQDVHYWRQVHEVGPFAPGDQVQIVLDVEEGLNNIEVRTLNTDGTLSDPLQIRVYVEADAIVSDPTALTKISARHTGAGVLSIKTWVDTTVSDVTLWVSKSLPLDDPISTTAVTPTDAWTEVALTRTVSDGTYYVGVGSNGEVDVYTLVHVNTIQPKGVVVDIL